MKYSGLKPDKAFFDKNNF